MSQLEVDKIIPQSGTTLTIGDSGDTITISSGAGFQSNGIYDNSSSTSLFINGSNRVTVGTDSGYGLDNSADDFVVANILSNSGMSIVSNASNSSSIFFTDTGVSSIGKIVYSHSSDDMKFTTANSEAMRIDSSGNLLLGVTSTSIPGIGNTTLGASLRNNGGGSIAVSRGSDNAGYFNRNTNDGSIVSFRKDGTEIGQIGVKNADLYICSNTANHAGLTFTISNRVVPTDNTGSVQDNAVDLGTYGNRFKDLYLGGGLYVGGTGTANKLDDYEEGTFTPSFSSGNGFGSLSYVFQRGTYTKIGRIVNIRIQIELGSGVTKNGNRIIMDGLPFTSSSALPGTGLNWSYVNSKVIGSTTTNIPTLWVTSNNNSIQWYKTDGSDFTGNDTSGSTTNMDIYINGTYQTDA